MEIQAQNARTIGFIILVQPTLHITTLDYTTPRLTMHFPSTNISLLIYLRSTTTTHIFLAFFLGSICFHF